MKKRFTEEQIIGFLREADKGIALKELCRTHGFSEASYYLWRSKYGGMDVSDAKRLKKSRGGITPSQYAKQLARKARNACSNWAAALRAERIVSHALLFERRSIRCQRYLGDPGAR